VDGGRTSPIIETLRKHWQLVMRAAQLSVFDAVTFLVMFVYVASWLQSLTELRRLTRLKSTRSA
jgi:hypothetical protein